MLNLNKTIITLILFFLAPVCYAIQVSVETFSDDVYAIGFTVNGEQYGAPGRVYSANNLPSGAVYTFGIRIGGLVFGAEDIACVTVNGLQSSVVLNADSKTTLIYDSGNKKCYMEIRYMPIDS